MSLPRPFVIGIVGRSGARPVWPALPPLSTASANTGLREQGNRVGGIVGTTIDAMGDVELLRRLAPRSRTATASTYFGGELPAAYFGALFPAGQAIAV